MTKLNKNVELLVPLYYSTLIVHWWKHWLWSVSAVSPIIARGQKHWCYSDSELVIGVSTVW